MASGSEGQRPVIRHVSFDRVREDIEPAEAHRLSRRTRVQIEDRVNHPDAPEGTVRLQMAPKRDKTGKAKLLPTVIDEEDASETEKRSSPPTTKAVRQAKTWANLRVGAADIRAAKTAEEVQAKVENLVRTMEELKNDDAGKKSPKGLVQNLKAKTKRLVSRKAAECRKDTKSDAALASRDKEKGKESAHSGSSASHGDSFPPLEARLNEAANLKLPKVRQLVSRHPAVPRKSLSEGRKKQSVSIANEAGSPTEPQVPLILPTYTDTPPASTISSNLSGFFKFPPQAASTPKSHRGPVIRPRRFASDTTVSLATDQSWPFVSDNAAGSPSSPVDQKTHPTPSVEDVQALVRELEWKKSLAQLEGKTVEEVLDEETSKRKLGHHGKRDCSSGWSGR